jgi:metallophosphoesterase (TIGR03767 family)
MDRRAFLVRGGAAAATALWVPWASGCHDARSDRGHGRDRDGRDNGGFGNDADLAVSTLDATVVAATATGAGRAGGDTYVRLTDGPGWPTVVRDDLADPQRGREDRRRPLGVLVHLTDLHLIDVESPGRVEFIDPAGEPFTGAFRPQEALTLHVAASMVTRVRAVRRGPITGRRFDCVVSTGDNIDNQQLNEARWFVRLLDGGRLRPGSGSRDAYEGVQQQASGAGGGRDGSTVAARYWHPAEGARDEWKDDRGFPDVPGLLDAARVPFRSPGVGTRWFSTYGNHDGLIQGTVPSTETTARVMVDRWKPLAVPDGMTEVAYLAAVLSEPPDTLLRKLANGDYPAREVTPDPDRRPLSPREWVQLHLDSPDRPGPAGHGYTEDHLEAPALYYEMEIAPGVVGLSLDTGGYYSGSLGEDQVRWLEERLIASSSRYFDADGTEVRTGHDDRLVLVFSHFPWTSMNSTITDPERPDERRVLGPEVVALLHRFPNVVAWINGHHHVNRVEAIADPAGRSGGFWDVNTASHVDHPQHARVVELVDNDDGTLSLFLTMLEHAAPARVGYDTTSLAGLASISRELSANDPQSDRDQRRGGPRDLNVELVLDAPFDLAAAGLG